MTHRGYRHFNTTEDEEEEDYMTLSERIARLSTSRVNSQSHHQSFSPSSSSWQPKGNYNNLADNAPEPFTYLRNNNNTNTSKNSTENYNNSNNKIIYAQVVVDNNLSNNTGTNNNHDTFNNNKYTVHRAYNNNSSQFNGGGYKKSAEVKRSNTNVTRVMLNSSDEYDDYQQIPTAARPRINDYRTSVDPEPINYFDYNKKKTLRVNDFYQPESYFYDEDDSIVKNHRSPTTTTNNNNAGTFSEWRSSNQLNHGKYSHQEDGNYEKLEMPVNTTNNNTTTRNTKKNLFSTLNKFFTNKSKGNNKKKEDTYQSYEKPYSPPPAVVIEPPTPQVNQVNKNYYGGHLATSTKEHEGTNYKDEPLRPNKVKRRWTMREKDSNATNKRKTATTGVDDGLKIGSQTLDRNYSQNNNKNRTSFIGGYNTLDNNSSQRKSHHQQQHDHLSVPSSRGYYKKRGGGLGVSSAEEDMTSETKYTGVGKSYINSSPLPSNRGSNKVYLHDQTVIDLIPKMNNTGSSASRRTVSKDDISIISRSTGQMHQSRQLSRSMSVVAPWGPTRNRKELDYSAYNNTLPVNRSNTMRKRSNSPRLPGIRAGSSGNSSKIMTTNNKSKSHHHQQHRPAVVSSSIESLIHNQNQQRSNNSLMRSKSFQQSRNKNDTIKRENKFTSWLRRK